MMEIIPIATMLGETSWLTHPSGIFSPVGGYTEGSCGWRLELPSANQMRASSVVGAVMG